MSSFRLLVLGIGNTLLSDEGVGVHVVDALSGQLGGRDDVTLLDGGTLSFTLAEEIAGHTHLIVVDATRAGGAPGAVVLFENEAMERHLRGNRRSVHEVGLSDLLDIARLSDTLPPFRALVGVEPAVIDWGEQPSPAVREAIPLACETVMTLAERWYRLASPS
ncbi:HyaD/HybD family hydrogenase maturation endopeptidase [Endothiovibrio diazotrophicus]